MSKLHHLACTPENVHWGYLDANLPPALRVESGDRVSMECISGGPEVVPKSGFEILPDYAAIHAAHKRTIGPHILTGPVYVEGAEPGDVLEIWIHEVRLRQDWGYNTINPLGGTIPEDFPIQRSLIIPIERNAMVATL
ncbi:MAG TPA: acetamidase/formamidase family protein, partial [Sphingomicrobium sp.]